MQSSGNFLLKVSHLSRCLEVTLNNNKKHVGNLGIYANAEKSSFSKMAAKMYENLEMRISLKVVHR